MGKAIEETFKLTQSETGVTGTDITVAATEPMQVMWEYLVPVGHSLIFRSTDHLSAYLYDLTDSAECHATAIVDVVIQDSAKRNTRSVMDTTLYTRIKNFADPDYFTHLDLLSGEVAVAREGDRIQIRGNLAGDALDVSESYFELTCHRIRASMF